jgi:membrane associated rhomboid family serine protease
MPWVLPLVTSTNDRRQDRLIAMQSGQTSADGGCSPQREFNRNATLMNEFTSKEPDSIGSASTKGPRTFRQEVTGVALFIAVMWVVYAVDWVVPAALVDWGLIPRTMGGLWGIVTSPFLHANLGHLISNTIPLVILLLLLCGSRARTWPTVLEIVVLGGLLLWIIGRSAVHVGASGLIYGLIAYLIVSGFREGRLLSLFVAIVVGFLYGGTLVSGVLPTVGPGVSWDGHLCGAVAGGLLGYFGVGVEPKTT